MVVSDDTEKQNKTYNMTPSCKLKIHAHKKVHIFKYTYNKRVYTKHIRIVGYRGKRIRVGYTV